MRTSLLPDATTAADALAFLSMKRLLALLLLSFCVSFAQTSSKDLLQLQTVGQVVASPDGQHIAYTVHHNDGGGRGYSQLLIMDIGSGKSTTVVDRGGDPVWSRDGRWIAFQGAVNGKGGLYVAHADGRAPSFLAETQDTNTPMQMVGNDIAWSPDSQRIAFVSATPGPETKDATGDPVVITRYLYKPDLSEGNTRFGDNRRLHIFVVNRAGGAVQQLTSGNNYEHSIDWSPNGQEILFVSNREPDADRFFNSDIFAVRVDLGASGTRRITATEFAEYQPRWSPDGKQILFLGTKRGLTDLETTMEDTHVWTMNADGSNRRELGAAIDNRQFDAQWSHDGQGVNCIVQERGETHVYRLPLNGSPQLVVGARGNVSSYAETKSGLAYALASATDPSEIFLARAVGEPRALTNLNPDYMRGKLVGEVESFTFVSNDFKYNVEAFLTKPINFDPARKYPMIVLIHGGPHGQQGPALNYRAQVYATRGWATLMVNYRGSTGYGQKFADAVFRDQNGDEAQDVLYGVSAAMRRYPWIDRDRLGIEGVSYGGQLTAWITTQTNMFKAAIPTAAIINLISYSYMTYYNQYEAMEWGAYPHQDNLMETLWERSALKHVANAHTPTMIVHGENDNDVPIAEAEQWYIALKDVGTEAIMVRYPREGHGVREPQHQIDYVERSIAWYEKHFTNAPPRQ
ncbi:MAG TPA: S9 family peptidase [Terriglobales bacterium]